MDADQDGSLLAVADALARVGVTLCGICRAKGMFCGACPFSHPAGFVRFLTATPREFWLGENLPEGLRAKIEGERRPEKRGVELLEEIFGALVAGEATRMVNAKRPRGEVKALMSAPGLLRMAMGEYQLAEEGQQRRKEREEADARKRFLAKLKEGGDGAES